jgi:cytoskeleton protein RodZ
MSDESVVVTSPAAGTGDQTAGMLLRAAREVSGMHIGALAVAMKVPVKKLEALEADRLDELPDAVFVRALAASVCRTLKLDPAEILGKLPQSVRPQLDKNARGINMPVRESGMFVGNSLLAFVSRPAALVVIALLLAVVGILFVPETFSPFAPSEPQATVMPAPAVPEVPQSVKEGKVVLAPVESSPPTDPVASAALAPAAKAASAPVAQSAAVAVIAIPAKAVSASAPEVPAKVATSAVAVASQPVPVASGMLVFKAKASAWIRVRDNKGAIVFEKTLAAGESAAASGQPPLAVVVGNVAATEVLVRGQTFSLDEMNQNNVARFEVK